VGIGRNRTVSAITEGLALPIDTIGNNCGKLVIPWHFSTLN
jgi:hypothetical protein